MKNIFSKTALLAATLTLSITALNAQGNIPLQNDSMQNGLLLNIDITSDDILLRDATVKIYHNNEFVASLSNTLQPEMVVTLEKETYYVLEVSKPGYVSKSLLISTVFPKNSSKNENTKYVHDVSVSLDRKYSSKSKNTESIIGILYYDFKRDIYVGSPMEDESPDKQAIIGQLENWLEL